nr:hypothetical protein [Tanacetum cinerariifolium]
MNEMDGSVDAKGLVLVFFGLSLSPFSLYVGSSSWESLCCLGWIVMTLIKPWIWVKHCGSSVGLRRSKMSFHQALNLILKLDEAAVGCTQDILRKRDCLDRLSEIP